MARKKKTRGGMGPVIYLDVKRRSEKLADPDSYESRKRRSLEQKKKHKSVYQKELDKANEGDNDSERRETPLAEKIRRLKAKERARQAESDDE